MATMMTACQIEAWQSCGKSLMMPASSEIVTRHVMAFGEDVPGTVPGMLQCLKTIKPWARNPQMF